MVSKYKGVKQSLQPIAPLLFNCEQLMVPDVVIAFCTGHLPRIKLAGMSQVPCLRESTAPRSTSTTEGLLGSSIFNTSAVVNSLFIILKATQACDTKRMALSLVLRRFVREPTTKVGETQRTPQNSDKGSRCRHGGGGTDVTLFIMSLLLIFNNTF